MEQKFKFEIADIVYYLEEDLPNYYRIIEQSISNNNNWYLIKEISDKQLLKQGWVIEDELEVNIGIVSE